MINNFEIIDERLLNLAVELGHFPSHKEFQEEYEPRLDKDDYDELVNNNYAWTKGNVPHGYWNSRNKKRAIKWVYEKCKKEKKKMSKKYLKRNGLGGLIINHYNKSPLQALKEAYPNDQAIQETPWMVVTQLPAGYWVKKHRIKAIKWVYEKCKKEKKELTNYYFTKNGLGGLIQRYNGSPLRALQEAYPEDQVIQETPWIIKELKKLPSDYWTKENRIKAIKWVYEKAKKENKKITGEYLTEKGLGGLISGHYNNSPLRALQEAYPDDPIIQEKPWIILKAMSNGYWTKEHRIKAIKWVYEKCKKEKKELTKYYFSKNGLKGLLDKHYNGSPLTALQATYPDDPIIQETPWKIITKLPEEYWAKEENIIKAIKTIYDDLEKSEELNIKKIKEKGLSKVYDWWYNNKETGIQGLRDFYDNYFINKAKELSKRKDIESTIRRGVKGDYEKADIKLPMLALLNNYLPEIKSKPRKNNGNNTNKIHENKEIVRIEYQ